MPFPPTPSVTSSNTPTPSVTASQTPTYSPTGTVCPGATPTATETPTQTQTQTSTIPVTPTQTQTNTSTPQTTPTSTPTPSVTNPISGCSCYSVTYETVPEGLQVRWRDCETGTVLTQSILTLITIDNGDGTFTSFICVAQGSTYATPVCVSGGLEVICDPLTWVEGGLCNDSIDCVILDDCTVYSIDNSTNPSSITWSGLECITGIPTGGTIPANTTMSIPCIVTGSISTTGSPIISILSTC